MSCFLIVCIISRDRPQNKQVHSFPLKMLSHHLHEFPCVYIERETFSTFFFWYLDWILSSKFICRIGTKENLIRFIWRHKTFVLISNLLPFLCFFPSVYPSKACLSPIILKMEYAHKNPYLILPTSSALS